MTAVTASPASSLASTGPTLIPGAPQAAASDRCPGACGEGLPADFASMLKVLQSIAGAEANPASARSSEVLGQLDVAESGEESINPADIATLLGQLGALAAPAGANPTAAAARAREDVSLRDGQAVELRGQLRPEIAAANPAKLTDPAVDQDSAEPRPDFSTPEMPTVDHASLRGNEANPARGPHTERARLDVPTPVHSPNWSSEVGQRVVWMANNSVQEAQLSVNPPHLGPIEITLSLKDDNATARFFSPHAEVREILEQGMPRLREMLAGAGVQLGQSDVGAQSQQAFQQFSGRQNHGAGEGQPSFREEHPSLHAQNAVNQSVSVRHLRGNGLVDTFV